MQNLTLTGIIQLSLNPGVALTEHYDAQRLTGSLWIVSLFLLFYDILLTLDVEIKYFWNSRPGFVSALFFLNRYWPAANLILRNIIMSLSHPNPSVCTFWFQYIGYSISVEHLAVGAILTLRVYAMYSRNKGVLVILLLLYALSMTAETIIIGVTTHHFQNLRGISGCVPINIPAWCWVYWVPLATLDTVLLFFVLWKAFQMHRSSTLKTPLFAMFLGDSILYFGGVTMMTLVNFLAWYIKPNPLYGTFVGCHICLQSILGCRLLLNLRELMATTRDYEYQDTCSIQSTGGILTTGIDVTLII